MFTGTIKRGAPALVAGALALGLAPAGAAAKPSIAGAARQLKAADAALVKVVKFSHHHHTAAARRAVATVQADIAGAAQSVAAVGGSAGAGTEAAAFAQIAEQYAADVKQFTSLLSSTGGSLATVLAQSLKPDVTGETQALGVVASLTKDLPASGAAGAVGGLGSLLGGGSSELSSLSNLLGGGSLPPQVQSILAQVFATQSGAITAVLAELEALVPDLPAAAQPYATQVLTQLQSILSSVSSTIGSTTSSSGTGTASPFGSGLTGMLGGITQLLQSLLGGIGNLTGTGTTTGTGTGTTGSGSTTSLPGLGSLGSLLGGLGLNLPGLGGIGSGTGSTTSTGSTISTGSTTSLPGLGSLGSLLGSFGLGL